MTDQPMQANDAEVSVLGAAMSGADIDELADVLEAEDFYQPSRVDVWRAILTVHSSGQQPDMISVRTALDAAGIKHDPLELFRMVELVPIVANAVHYAREVASAAGHRAIAQAGIKLGQLGTTLGDLDQRREQARQAVDEACRGRTVHQLRKLSDVLPAVLDQAQNGRAGAISTPWSDVDELIGGLAPGRLVIVGARPGIGKSVMGTNLALHVAHKHQHAALIASMEMPEDEVTQRLVSAHARVNLTDLIDGKTDEASWQKIANAHAELDAMPLYIDDEAEQSIQHIRAKARDVRRHRDDLALIVVDYLQLMATSGRSENRATELAGVSRGLKQLARETGSCVVALAQVNRNSAKRDDRPRQSDLRESGSIEADADQVILLHQPDDEIPEVEVIVDKNRHGIKGIRTLNIWGHYATLAPIGRPWTPRLVGEDR